MSFRLDYVVLFFADFSYAELVCVFVRLDCDYDVLIVFCKFQSCRFKVAVLGLIFSCMILGYCIALRELCNFYLVSCKIRIFSYNYACFKLFKAVDSVFVGIYRLRLVLLVKLPLAVVVVSVKSYFYSADSDFLFVLNSVVVFVVPDLSADFCISYFGQSTVNIINHSMCCRQIYFISNCNSILIGVVVFIKQICKNNMFSLLSQITGFSINVTVVFIPGQIILEYSELCNSIILRNTLKVNRYLVTVQSLFVVLIRFITWIFCNMDIKIHEYIIAWNSICIYFSSEIFIGCPFSRFIIINVSGQNHLDRFMYRSLIFVKMIQTIVVFIIPDITWDHCHFLSRNTCVIVTYRRSCSYIYCDLRIHWILDSLYRYAVIFAISSCHRFCCYNYVFIRRCKNFSSQHKIAVNRRIVTYTIFCCKIWSLSVSKINFISCRITFSVYINCSWKIFQTINSRFIRRYRIKWCLWQYPLGTVIVILSCNNDNSAYNLKIFIGIIKYVIILYTVVVQIHPDSAVYRTWCNRCKSCVITAYIWFSQNVTAFYYIRCIDRILSIVFYHHSYRKDLFRKICQIICLIEQIAVTYSIVLPVSCYYIILRNISVKFQSVITKMSFAVNVHKRWYFAEFINSRFVGYRWYINVSFLIGNLSVSILINPDVLTVFSVVVILFKKYLNTWDSLLAVVACLSDTVIVWIVPDIALNLSLFNLFQSARITINVNMTNNIIINVVIAVNVMRWYGFCRFRRSYDIFICLSHVYIAVLFAVIYPQLIVNSVGSLSRCCYSVSYITVCVCGELIKLQLIAGKISYSVNFHKGRNIDKCILSVTVCYRVIRYSRSIDLVPTIAVVIILLQNYIQSAVTVFLCGII